MILRSTIVAGALAVAIGLPGVSLAAPATTSTAMPAVPASVTASSKSATKTATVTKKAPLKPTYDLDWTLPTAGKSGCDVCHGDQNLMRIQSGKIISLYVDTEVIQGSAHKNVPCTSCHVDFAYKTPHDTIVKNAEAWREVAKLSCKNCHKDAFTLYTSGAHSPAGRPGDTSSTVGADESAAPTVDEVSPGRPAGECAPLV
jgi:nitrate reductase cytochrome c-type subunit